MILINRCNEVVSIPNDSTYNYLAFEKDWAPLMPYIMADPLEMGVYSIETNKKYIAPFVWDNIKINSLEIDESKEGYEHGYYPNVYKEKVYKIQVIVYPYHYWKNADYKIYPHKSYTHTFYVKNGLFFFVDSVLRIINCLINDGCSIDTINFDFLDRQCEDWNSGAANGQSVRFNLPVECYPWGFYRLIDNMDIDIFKYACGSRNGSKYWKEVEIKLQTIDEYVIHIISNSTINRWWKHKHKPIVDTETKTTKFTFIIEEDRDDCAYIEYSKVPVDATDKDRIIKTISEELIIHGIGAINKESAIIFHSTKH